MKKLLIMTITGIMALAACSGNVSEIIKKAEQGDASAQLTYGRLLKTQGNGVDQDWEKAVTMLQRSADQGNHDAQWELGLMYEFANHVEKDEALRWYRISADQGYPEAIEALKRIQ